VIIVILFILTLVKILDHMISFIATGWESMKGLSILTLYLLFWYYKLVKQFSQNRPKSKAFLMFPH